ncbi:MAG: PH domain-containing protein [Bacilli bacterium]|nr:PH domain-containing protein [Bacilli bacterium]
MPNIDENYFKPENNIEQNTVEDVLNKDEKILVRLKPNKKVFILEALLGGLLFAILFAAFDTFVISMMLRSGMVNGVMIAFLVVFFAIHLLPVWLYIANVVRKVGGYKNVEYCLTNERIILRSGLVGISFKSILYGEILSVNTKVGILDRIFKVGDIVIVNAAGQTTLDDIDKPYFYASKIQTIVRDLQSDIHYPNDLRPKENHGYKTTYVPDDDKK